MLKVSASSNFHYYISGDKPKILIHSGTHGDEGDVTQYVMKALEKYEKALPPFLFIPEVSPTAIDSCLRNNAFGNDMNRKFFSDSHDPEVQVNIEVIIDKKFDMFLSFHEDADGPDYYLYDVGYRKTENEVAKKHNQLLKSKGINLLNGVDDPDDEDLGFVFVEGYNKMIFQQSDKDDGTISAWVLNRHMAEEYLLPEIPGKAGGEIKEYMVDSFFSEVVLKSF